MPTGGSIIAAMPGGSPVPAEEGDQELAVVRPIDAAGAAPRPSINCPIARSIVRSAFANCFIAKLVPQLLTAGAANMTTIVTLDVFSGRQNPSLQLSDADEKELHNRLSAATTMTHKIDALRDVARPVAGRDTAIKLANFRAS